MPLRQVKNSNQFLLLNPGLWLTTIVELKCLNKNSFYLCKIFECRILIKTIVNCDMGICACWKEVTLVFFTVLWDYLKECKRETYIQHQKIELEGMCLYYRMLRSGCYHKLSTVVGESEVWQGVTVHYCNSPQTRVLLVCLSLYSMNKHLCNWWSGDSK